MENNNEYMETTLTFTEPDLTDNSDMDKSALKTSPEFTDQKNDAFVVTKPKVSDQQNNTAEIKNIKYNEETEKIDFIPSENSNEVIPKVNYTNDRSERISDLGRENNDTTPKRGDYTNDRPASIQGTILNMTSKSDEGIDNKKVILPEDLVKYDVFISYNWGIKESVEKFHNSLEEAGFKVWRDKNLLQGKASLFAQLGKKIKQSSVFLCFLTRAYVKSDNCLKEFNYAAKLKKSIMYLMIENLPQHDEIPEEVGFVMGNALYTQCYNNPDSWWKDNFNEIKDSLKEELVVIELFSFSLLGFLPGLIHQLVLVL